jgi:hypothetical protein
MTLVFDEAGGVVELVCARKLLKDFSETFKLMDLMVGDDRINITGLFGDLRVNSATTTFIQLYDMMQAGGLPVPVSGDISFTSLVGMYIMADFLAMPLIQDWVETYVKAKILELSTNWMRDYATARMLQGVPQAHRTAGHVPNPHLSPMQQQAARLLDVQEAYMQARFNPRAKVVLPSQLARLVSGSCPAELRFRLQVRGQLRPEFVGALAIFDLKRHVQIRRLANAGQHH